MNFSFFFSLFFSISLYALDQNQLQTLSQDKIWHALLHYNEETGKSEILNNDFFLSIDGNKNPKSELEATIKFYNTHLSNGLLIQCKYPARYLWLSNYINDIQAIEIDKCKQLKQWNLNKHVTSISTVFVSGFLGNPASAFGHSFFKINQTSKENRNLLDSTVSYGAILPSKYTMLSYMYNGLMGGYDASYSDKYFYMDDMVYSNQEFREMWEYKLQLNTKQQNLFLLHLWELRGVHFPYYFFNRNCGYHATELLELLSKEKMLGSAKVWYAPIETFYAIEKHLPLESVTYHPSAQQRIYTFYQSFSEAEKKIIETMILKKESKGFENLSVNQKIKVLDFILDFYTYKAKTLDKDSNALTLLKKEKLYYLSKRLNFPISQYSKEGTYTKAKITQNNKPMMLETSWGYLNSSYTALLRFSPFTIDATGYNHYKGDILSVLDGTLAIDDNGMYLKQLDILKIRRLKTKELPFDIESPLSWSVNLGFNNTKDKDYFLSIGAGYSWQFSKYCKGYVMLETSLHSNNQHYRLNPYLGLLIDGKELKVDIQYGKENRFISSIYKDKMELEVQYKVAPNKALYLHYEKDDNTFFSIGMKWYF
jgi:hypothetical protein